MINNSVNVKKDGELPSPTTYLESFTELAISNGTLAVELANNISKVLTIYMSGYTTQSNYDDGYASEIVNIYMSNNLRYESWYPKTTSKLTLGGVGKFNGIEISGNQVLIDAASTFYTSAAIVDVVICYQ